jgi:protein-S-isoprenylcysteine O-methyltransferase Ste14
MSWSDPVRIESVRHPIYTGGIAASVGTALVVGEAGAFAGVALVVSAWLAKMRTEERLLAGEFGSAYEQYRRTVKAVVPFVL